MSGIRCQTQLISTHSLFLKVLLNVRYNFTERAVNVWNLLPNTVDFNSLAVCKRTFK